IVIVNPELKEDFGFHVKQKGALLAKGRLIGIQFMELMKDNLYFDLAKSANQKAMKIKAAFEAYHCSFLTDSYSNQLFPIIPNSWIEK
ncbi:low specificity L-threonine aldolase, partial [Klebsiella pneumoniae]|nr:low specificity L-threonine aldolase [Klebsiella pneumoniae]